MPCPPAYAALCWPDTCAETLPQPWPFSQVRAQAKALAAQRTATYQMAMAAGQQEAVGQLEAAWEAEKAHLAARLADQHRQVHQAISFLCA